MLTSTYGATYSSLTENGYGYFIDNKIKGEIALSDEIKVGYDYDPWLKS